MFSLINTLSYEVYNLLCLFNKQVIYIAPLKAIVRERMSDWQKRLVSQLRKKMVLMFLRRNKYL